jgi:hypothetical protein
MAIQATLSPNWKDSSLRTESVRVAWDEQLRVSPVGKLEWLSALSFLAEGFQG